MDHEQLKEARKRKFFKEYIVKNRHTDYNNRNRKPKDKAVIKYDSDIVEGIEEYETNGS